MHRYWATETVGLFESAAVTHSAIRGAYRKCEATIRHHFWGHAARLGLAGPKRRAAAFGVAAATRRSTGDTDGNMASRRRCGDTGTETRHFLRFWALAAASADLASSHPPRSLLFGSAPPTACTRALVFLPLRLRPSRRVASSRSRLSTPVLRNGMRALPHRVAPNYRRRRRRNHHRPFAPTFLHRGLTPSTLLDARPSTMRLRCARARICMWVCVCVCVRVGVCGAVEFARPTAVPYRCVDVRDSDSDIIFLRISTGDRAYAIAKDESAEKADVHTKKRARKRKTKDEAGKGKDLRRRRRRRPFDVRGAQRRLKRFFFFPKKKKTRYVCTWKKKSTKKLKKMKACGRARIIHPRIDFHIRYTAPFYSHSLRLILVEFARYVFGQFRPPSVSSVASLPTFFFFIRGFRVRANRTESRNSHPPES